MTDDVSVELNKLINICHSNLKNSKECIDYLYEKRGLNENIVSKYKIGYFPRNASKLNKFISPEVLQKINIIDYSETSRFSEFFYLIFPIYSEYGDPVGIGGRTLLENEQRNILGLPKYKNSSFKKANYLFGLNNSRSNILKEQNVYVVEGYFDHIALDQNGIKNSVAICGTAFSKNHLLKLTRYTSKITFVLDRDDGGKNSMKRIYSKYCNQGIKLRFIMLPENCKDVDEYFANGGDKESFLNKLEDYLPTWEGLNE
jgi:DNA primase